MFEIKATGINEFLFANKKLIKRLESNEDFERMLDAIVEKARANCPVKTGDMEKSIRWEMSGVGKYVIICDVPYAMYIEYGTRYFPVPDDPSSPRGYKSSSGKMASVPFLRSAIWDVSREFPGMIQNQIDIIYLNK